jgi:hypothetical protein
MNALLSSFSPEMQLVLCAARVEPGDAAAATLDTLLARDLDWKAVGRYARENEVQPLVHRTLSRREEGQVPTEVLDRLADASRDVALDNLRFDQTLRRLVDELEAADIPVIPFKGPALARRAYGNSAYRQYVDLDLLVQRSDFYRAKAELQEKGYEPYRDLDDDEEADFVDSKLGYELVNRADGTVVELHWGLFYDIYGFGFDPEALWQRHERSSFAGQPIRVLAPEDLMRYLCVHGTKHRFLKLKWLCDVAAFVRAQPDLDWATVQRRARETGTERMCLLALYLAHHLLGAAVPPALLRSARADSTLRALAETLCSNWLLRDPERSESETWDVFWFHVRERERLRDRLPYVWHHVKLAMAPSEKDREWVDLPEALSFLYVFVRPLRLLREWGGRLFTGQAVSR